MEWATVFPDDSASHGANARCVITAKQDEHGNTPIFFNGVKVATIKPFASGGVAIDAVPVSSPGDKAKTGLAFDNDYVRLTENDTPLNY